MDDTYLQDATPETVLRWAIPRFGSSLALCTGFQAEGMVLIDMAARIDPSIRVLTVDTGRLPDETYRMIDTVHLRYGIRAETVTPDSGEIEEMTRLHGSNLFLHDQSMRLLCCQIRKVRPLERRLRDFSAWVVGLRRSQSDSRSALEKIERIDGRLKLSPLADWSYGQVQAYIRDHRVPLHPLYTRGFTSIGCAPCTRATAPGEDERAGRWWWELDAAKECGIHYAAHGRLRRHVDVLLEDVLLRNDAVTVSSAK